MKEIEEKTMMAAPAAKAKRSRFLKAMACVAALAVSFPAAGLAQDKADDGVVYDLDIIETFPPVGAVDMTTVTWDVTLVTWSHDYNYRPGARVSLANAKGTYDKEGPLEDSSETADLRTVKLIHGPEPSENGTYTLTIPQGSFGDAAWLADPAKGHSNPEIKVVWRVYNAAGTTAAYDVEVLSTSPADKGTADIGSSPFKLTVTGPGELGYIDGVYATLVNAESHYEGKVRFTSAADKDGNTVFSTAVTPEITRNGTYTLSIPEGMFGDLPFAADSSEGHGNVPYTMSFEVTGGLPPKGPVEYDLVPEVTPANGSTVSYDEVKYLLFVFPEGTDWVNENDAKAILRCQPANFFGTALFRRLEDAPGTFYLKFGNKVYRDGEYSLVLNKGIFMDADKEHSNPEITYTWNVVASTGIDGVESEEDAVPGVYDLNGVYMGADAKGLPAGVYVVKGKKVLVTGN